MSEVFRALTSREAETCLLLARRLNTLEIATNLHISRRTVEKHIEGIFKKLCVRSREQLRRKIGAQPPAILASDNSCMRKNTHFGT
jgi:DNA-binding NarL/FixJ family response regulator